LAAAAPPSPSTPGDRLSFIRQREIARGWIGRQRGHAPKTSDQGGARDGQTPGFPCLPASGSRNINGKDRNATFGIAKGDKGYWSKGYGTEAAGLIIVCGFWQLNLRRINSSVIACNERSAGMHRKLGFVEGSRQREGISKN
jgi:hypothetical protein